MIGNPQRLAAGTYDAGQDITRLEDIVVYIRVIFVNFAGKQRVVGDISECFAKLILSFRVESFREVLEATARQGVALSAGSLAFWLWELGHLSTIPDGIAEPYRLLIGGRPIEAAAMWEAKGIPYEQALALMHGDDSEQLQALRILEGLGASATAGRVRRSLLDRGVRVPRGKSMTTRDHAVGLTARQAEVLDLLAEGLTSSEIADRLFISSRTVENHVAAILMKLDVTSRHAAVDLARDLGLLAAPRPAEEE